MRDGAREFIGFGDEFPQMQDDFGDRVLSGLPQTWSLRNETLAPLFQHDRIRHSGRAPDGDGRLPRLALCRGYGSERPAKSIAPEPYSGPAESHLERAWFGGYFFPNFGHFLLESLARVLSAEVAVSDDPIVFLSGRPHARIYRPFQNILEKVGIAPERAVIVSAPLSVGELRGQDAAYEFKGRVHPDAYRRVQEPGGARIDGKIVYLSRARFEPKVGSDKRWAMDEDVLERRLEAEFGAEIVYPETLSFAEQIAKFAQAQFVIGCEGSAFYTAMFLADAPHTIKLCGASIPVDLPLAEEVSNGCSTYLYASTEPLTPQTKRHAPWRLDVERVVDTLRPIVSTGRQ
jgi:capsular polysaccharide biosynthesis protein